MRVVAEDQSGGRVQPSGILITRLAVQPHDHDTLIDRGADAHRHASTSSPAGTPST